MRDRNYGFDFFRVFLIIFIVLYHFRVVQTGYLACDCFFVISGFFLASSFFREKNIISSSVFLNMVRKKIARLYPEYLFALIISLLFYFFIHNQHQEYSIFYNLLFIGEIGAYRNIVNGGWFISVLFWGSFLYIAALSWLRLVTCYFLAPVIFLFGSIILYSQFHSLKAMGDMYNSFLTYGFIRGMVGLSVGLFSYYICSHISANLPKLKPVVKTAFITLLEISNVLLLVFLLLQSAPSVTDFNVYFPAICLIYLIESKQKVLLKFVDWHGWEQLGRISYMIFLTNILVRDFLNHYFPSISKYPTLYKAFFCCLVCFIFASICYHTQKWLFTKLKQILLIAQPSKSEQHIENTIKISGGNETIELDETKILQR